MESEPPSSQGDRASPEPSGRVDASHEATRGKALPHRLGSRLLSGRYRLGEVLASGGFGTVYRGSYRILDQERPVAIKLLRANATDAASVIRFREEVRSLCMLAHPNICSVIDGGVDDSGQHFLVMQETDGGSLAQQLEASRNRRIDPVTARRWLREAATGLLAAERNVGPDGAPAPICHRDIKPANLLLHQGHVVVADFGAAKLGGAHEGVTSELVPQVWTPNYGSPEQQFGVADHRSDIYSLGATFFELLTGSVPAARFADRQDRFTQAHDPSNVCSEVPSDLGAIVARMTAPEPSQRYSSFADVIAALDAVAATRVGLGMATIVVLHAGGALLLTAGAALVMMPLWPDELREKAGPFGSPDAEYVGWAIVVVVTLAVLSSRVLNWLRDRRSSAIARGSSIGAPATTADRPHGAITVTNYNPRANAASDDEQTNVAPLATEVQRRLHADARPPVPPLASAHETKPLQVTASGLRVALTIQRSPDPLLLGRRIQIENFPFSIGRDSGNNLVADDCLMSRTHASIDLTGNVYELRDHGSANGTFVNGRRLAPNESVALCIEDVVVAANTILLFTADVRPLPDLSGTVLDGRFRLKQRRHSSIKSSVYVAVDERLGREVALKLFSPSLDNLANYRGQMRSEAELGGRMGHPHICKVHDLAETELLLDGFPVVATYLTMDLLRGGNLTTKLAAGPLSRVLVLEWLGTLAKALRFAHEHNVVHGALKPNSVLFDDTDHAYVADFASGFSAERRGHSPAFGAPAFLAPEQWAGQLPTHASDQYSLAVLAYLMLTGKLPHEGQDQPQVRARNWVRGPFPAHEAAAINGYPALEPRVSVVLARAMQVEPSNRFETIDAFVQDLTAAARSAGAQRSPRVFLSYRRDTSGAWAVLLSRRLKEKHAIDSFLDTDRRDSGVEIPAKIERAIRECDVFVCLLGRDTLDSKWVRREVELAHRMGKPHVPVFQECFRVEHHTQDATPEVRTMLDHDGVHLFDQKVVHIDHTIDDLAELVQRTHAARQ